MPRRYADYKGITSAILCLGFRVKVTAIGTWGGVGERGVGTKTKIPLLRLINQGQFQVGSYQVGTPI